MHEDSPAQGEVREEIIVQERLGYKQRKRASKACEKATSLETESQGASKIEGR